MPEKVGFSRLKLVREARHAGGSAAPSPYVELEVTTPFSFLRGASDAIELVLALELGMEAIGIADRNTLAGVVRMHSACREAGAAAADRLPARPDGCAGRSPTHASRDGCSRLSRLLSLGKMRAKKGECELPLADVAAHSDGIAFIAWPSRRSRRFRGRAAAPS